MVNATLEKDTQILYPFTNPYNENNEGSLAIVDGDGIYVKDKEGNKYIEAIAGLWSTSLGFSQNHIIQEAMLQMQRLPSYHTGNMKTNNPAIELAERLLAIAPGKYSRVFFCSSGSEANDTQIKLTWYYNNALGNTNKKKIISRKNAYHGSTIITSGLAGLDECIEGFDVTSDRFLITDCTDYNKYKLHNETENEFSIRLANNMERLIIEEGSDTIAAFIAEPVMAAGGVIIPPLSYFPQVKSVLEKYDIRLISDEVICGFGRTGEMWGSETFNMLPNSISAAKALTSGYLPMGAVLIDDEMSEVILKQSKKTSFSHGFTSSGHPVTAAVALATLDLMDDLKILEKVRSTSKIFERKMNEFSSHKLVKNTRSVGLIGAMDLINPIESKLSNIGKTYWDIAQRNGVIVRNIGDTIALCPPLIITESELNDMFNKLKESLDELLDEVNKLCSK